MIAATKKMKFPLPHVWTLLVALTGLSGCSVFEKSETKPLFHHVETSATEMDIYALKATHRLAYSQVYRVQGERRIRRLCSEPPPDVMSTFSDALNASVDATLQESGTDKAEVRAKIRKDFVLAVSAIYTRSQAVQLFRDGAFMLCQAHLNGAMLADGIQEKTAAIKDEIQDITQETKNLSSTIHNKTAQQNLSSILGESNISLSEKLKTLQETVNKLQTKEEDIQKIQTLRHRITLLNQKNIALEEEKKQLQKNPEGAQEINNAFNYTHNFQSLLQATKEILLAELSLLYKYKENTLLPALVVPNKNKEGINPESQAAAK